MSTQSNPGSAHATSACTASRSATPCKRRWRGSTRSCDPLEAEDVPLRAAAGRVLATPVVSDVDVPGFDRATMDGYAVVADSPRARRRTTGSRLQVIGDALPGVAVRSDAGARRGGAHHDRRADADRKRRGPAGRVGRSQIADASRDASTALASGLAREEHRPARRRHRCRHDSARGRTRAAPAGSRRDELDRPRQRQRRPPAARAARHHRQRAAPAGSRAARLPASPTPTDRCSPRSPNATARSSIFPASCATMPTRFSRRCRPTRTSIIVSGGSSVGIEDLAPMLVASAWRAGRARHRDAAEQPDRHGHARARAWSSCCRAIRCRRCAPTTSSPAARFARSAAARATGRIDRVRAHARAQDQLANRPPRLRARQGRRTVASSRSRSRGASVLSSTTRADGFVVVDDDSEGFAAGPKSMSGSMREQEQFLTGPRSRRSRAPLPRGGRSRAARHRAGRARCGARPRAGRRCRVASGRAVVRSLERRRLRGGRRRTRSAHPEEAPRARAARLTK